MDETRPTRLWRDRTDRAGRIVHREEWDRFGGYSAVSLEYDDGRVSRLWRVSGVGDEARREDEFFERSADGRLLLTRASPGGVPVWTRPTPPGPDHVDRLLELLARDVALAAQVYSAPSWLVLLVLYQAEGTMADYVVPTLSALAVEDAPGRGQEARSLGGWRVAWEWSDWSVPEVLVPLGAGTLAALEAASDIPPPDDVDERLAALGRALSSASTTVLAVDADLEGLASAIWALTPAERQRLEGHGLTMPPFPLNPGNE